MLTFHALYSCTQYNSTFPSTTTTKYTNGIRLHTYNDSDRVKFVILSDETMVSSYLFVQNILDF